MTSPSAGTVPGGGTSNPIAPETAAAQPAPMPLLRLTRAQFANTIRDLLPGVPISAEELDEDGSVAGFSTGATFSPNDASRLRDVAERIGRDAQARLAMILPCSPSPTTEDACARDFIARFGRRAYRRPLEAADTERLVALYTKARGELKLDFPNAIRIVIQLVVQSPDFLYRWERTPAATLRVAGGVRLGPYEMASRLSYLLWNTMPDDRLFDAAAKGVLDRDDGVLAEATRLLGDARAREAVGSFHRQWVLGEDRSDPPGKDAKRFPDYSPEVFRLMEDELAAFGAHTVLEAGAEGLRTLLAAPYSFLNARLAKLYGLTAVAGDALVRTALDPTQRAGLLAQGSFLARHATATESHPVRRGRWVYERLLCGTLPPQPDQVPEARPAAPDVSTRQRFADHATNPCATGCHGLIDPPGFALEYFDAVGRYRSMDGGKPVDATGTLKLPSGDTRPFKDAVDLTRILAQSADVRACVARQWMHFGLGRHVGPGDASALAALGKGLEGAGDLRALVLALVRTPSFSHRAASEVMP